MRRERKTFKINSDLVVVFYIICEISVDVVVFILRGRYQESNSESVLSLGSNLGELLILHNLEELKLLLGVLDFRFFYPPHRVGIQELIEFVRIRRGVKQRDDELVAQRIIVEVLQELVLLFIRLLQSSRHESAEPLDQVLRVVAIVLRFFLSLSFEFRRSQSS